METKRNNTWPYVVPILLLATLLGVYRINADVYWLDEEVSIMLSGGARYGQFPFDKLLSLHLEHTWPPLYNLLTTAWAAFAGWSEYSMRVLALFIGTLSIATIYRLGSKLVSPQVGIISAFFLGTSAFYIHYLHEARGYTLYVLLAITSIYLYRQILTGSHKTKRSTQGLFLLSVTAMLYTHFIATTIYAFLWGHHILHKPKDIRWHRITRLLLYSLLLFSPWIVLGINAAVDESEISRNMDTFMLLKSILLGFGNWMPLYIVGLLTYAALVIRGKHIGYLWKWAGTVLGLAVLINIPTQALYHIRHVLIILPSLLVLMAASVDDIFTRNRAAGFTLTAVWAIAGMYSYMSPDFMNNQPAHVRPILSETMSVMVDTLDNCATESDTAIFYAYEPEEEFVNNRVLHYYLYGLPSSHAQLATMREIPAKDDTLPEDYEAQAHSILDGADTVWFFMLSDMPRIEQLNTFEHIMIENYGYCGQVIDTTDLHGYVFTTDDTIGCQSEHFSVPETILTECTQSIIQTQDN